MKKNDVIFFFNLFKTTKKIYLLLLVIASPIKGLLHTLTKQRKNNYQL